MLFIRRKKHKQLNKHSTYFFQRFSFLFFFSSYFEDFPPKNLLPKLPTNNTKQQQQQRQGSLLIFKEKDRKIIGKTFSKVLSLKKRKIQ